MDCTRLPLAYTNDILYMYKHPNALKHVQNNYESNFTVNPKTVIKQVVPHEKMVANTKRADQSKLLVTSFIIPDSDTIAKKENIVPIVPTDQVRLNEPSSVQVDETVNTVHVDELANTVRVDEHTNTVHVDEVINATQVATQVATQAPQVITQETQDSWRFMVSHIDETSSLYTENMWRDAIDSMKQKLIVFMTAGSGHKKYGPKKSRTILAWLTDNKRGTPASDETALVIAHFISWLLDVKVSSVTTSVANANWIMYRKRGVWMLRTNV